VKNKASRGVIESPLYCQVCFLVAIVNTKKEELSCSPAKRRKRSSSGGAVASIWFGPFTVNELRGFAGCVVRARVSGMLPVCATPHSDLERSMSKDTTHWDVDFRLNSTELGLYACFEQMDPGGFKTQAMCMNFFGTK
jgi:hypothetical protein